MLFHGGKKMNIGQIISFGSYEWRVLDAQKDKALIITDAIIDQRPYHSAYTQITWAACSLREYLNNEFYNSFTSTQREKIEPALNKNHDNEWYGTPGGIDTLDKIFLLSIEDAVCRYFGDSKSLLTNPGKNQRYWFQRKDVNNNKRVAYHNNGAAWWWLRSPGRVGVKAAYIHGDGNIGIQGNNIQKGNLDEGSCKGGVRPALWLKI